MQDAFMSRRGFDLIVCLGLACLIGYLSWHAINGERSFSQAERLGERIATLRPSATRCAANAWRSMPAWR
jgi:hypothetical protein